MVDRHARIIDDLVHDAERISLRHPAEIVDRLRPVALPAGVDFVDRANLARLRLGEQILVVEAPPGRRVAAERFARVGRIGARPRLHVHDADFEDVARFGAADIDRTGADVDAEAFAGAAAEQLAVDRAGAAAIDALLVLGPQVDAFDARIALDHALGVVAGVMGYGLDGDVVARIHFELRLQELAEIAPMHGVGVRRQVMVGRLAGLGLRRSRRGQRAARRPSAAAPPPATNALLRKLRRSPSRSSSSFCDGAQILGSCDRPLSTFGSSLLWIAILMALSGRASSVDSRNVHASDPDAKPGRHSLCGGVWRCSTSFRTWLASGRLLQRGECLPSEIWAGSCAVTALCMPRARV